ncbi:hypothetical protein Aple_053380 [Acrocarpospora pleiomorpha]|uniref:Uncharacterized protein n=1 Tax=Acrocarpospora pleiomorpha TaxID=90975 RepID=A0A5M3XS63_9ACTN|nr:hypothetical protein Aple_053380 [Acrocarpospora pleiomorpha]
MTTPIRQTDWTVVDEGWGRKAADFATLSEPSNCRARPHVQEGLPLRAAIDVVGYLASKESS